MVFTRNLVNAETRSDSLELAIPWWYTSRKASVLVLSFGERREEKVSRCWDGVLVDIELGWTEDNNGFRAAQISQDLLLIFLSVSRRPTSS